MQVTLKLTITREDDKAISPEKREEIREELEQVIADLDLEEITLYAGTEREEQVALTVYVDEIATK